MLDWSMPIDIYKCYVSLRKSTTVVRLHSSWLSNDLKILDVVPCIHPSFFSEVIDDLTLGRTDKDFVHAADYIKNQIVVYGSGMGDYYRWPAETLTEGRRMCGDTAILMTSILAAGNNHAHCGMKISVWYVDSENMASPRTADHALVGIRSDRVLSPIHYYYPTSAIWYSV